MGESGDFSPCCLFDKPVNCVCSGVEKLECRVPELPVGPEFCSWTRFVWMMTRIYVIPTIPPWNSWYTGLGFISTTLCLGLITVLFLHYNFGCVTCDEQFINDGCVTCDAQFINDGCVTCDAQFINDVGCVTCYARFTNDQTSKKLVFYLIVILLIEIISGFYHQSKLQKMNTKI